MRHQILPALLLFASFFIQNDLLAQSNASNADDIRNQKAPADKALVFVVRDKMMGAVVPFRVECDGIFKGKNTGKRFLFFTCPPGTHTILSGGETTDELMLTVEAGKIYYLRQLPKMGIAAARSELVRVDDEQGVKLLKKTKLSGNCVECGTGQNTGDD